MGPLILLFHLFHVSVIRRLDSGLERLFLAVPASHRWPARPWLACVETVPNPIAIHLPLSEMTLLKL